jgi:4-hydroxybenzoate polyprenyltransferase
MARPADFARLVTLSHSIFALPFALAAALLAWREVPVTLVQLGLLVACLITARSSAMGFNRIVDRDFDARNPRTAQRELPRGVLSVRAAALFTAANAGVFVLCAALLGRATLALAPVALAVVWGYSFTKRFTPLSHLVLGLGLALAPTGVWIALTGSYGVVPALLSGALLTWVAGFDVLYACQDVGFDRQAGLHSIPAWLGIAPALRVSAALHVGTVALLAALGGAAALGVPYLVGLAIITGVLVWEHTLVRPDDLSRLDRAFFDLNGYVSLAFLVFVALDVVWP